jgi:Haem-dependent oxidative N-demethylase, alpha subunit-like
MREVFQRSLPYDVMDTRALPGIQPLDLNDWLIRDEAYDAQMAVRDHLLRAARPDVLAMDDGARAAAGELLDLVLGLAYPGAGAAVTRADGVRVAIDRGDPLGTLGRLVQEDLCILQKIGPEHVLTGAVVCFPASWLLADKFMCPLIGIHAPVEGYDDSVAARVQRMFDGVQPGRPLWRFNALWYDDPALHQPRGAHPVRGNEHQAPYLRSERQSILRLPQSGAVIFSIHTYLLRRADVAGAGR